MTKKALRGAMREALKAKASSHAYGSSSATATPPPPPPLVEASSGRAKPLRNPVGFDDGDSDSDDDESAVESTAAAASAPAIKSAFLAARRAIGKKLSAGVRGVKTAFNS
jgi:hypothetical protein